MKGQGTLLRLRPILSATVLGAAILAAVGCAARHDPSRVLNAAGGEVLKTYDRKIPVEESAAPSARASRFDRLPKTNAEEAAPSRTASRSPDPDASATADAADATSATPASADESPASAGQRPASRPEGFVVPLTRDAERVPISLEACLRRALVNNLSIQIARFEPAMAETAIVEAEALFDPSWFLNNALSRLREDAGTFLAGATTLTAKQWDFETGAETLLPTGATVGLTQAWTLLETSSEFYDPNPRYETEIGLEVRQPLLRGAGMEVTKSPIVLARLDHQISLEEFRAHLMDTLLEVEQTYWDLVVAETEVEALSEALEAARENLRIAQIRFEQGKDKRVIVSLAESAATSREADLIAARLSLAQTSDRLKRLINDPALPLEEPTLLEATERPIADPIPVSRALVQRSMLTAMKHRPEIKQADARLERMGLLERVARNDRLPRLDLAAGYGLLGLDAKTWRAMREQFGTEYFDWSVGVELEVPIGNRSRIAAHERARLEQAQAIAQREDTRQTILLEVSEAARDLASAEEAVLATRAAREAAEQTLRDQQANVGAGAALVKDLLEAQRDLADAKVREIQAQTQYMTSLARLERAKGTLLQYNNIQLLEEEDTAKKP